MSVSVRPAEEADRTALFGLYSVAFGSPPDPAEWAWKYDRNPNPSVSVVAEESDATSFAGWRVTTSSARAMPGKKLIQYLPESM